MGEIAAQKGLSEQVKDFGRTLRRDHQKNDANVVSLARDEGLSLTLNHRLVDQTITDFERRTRNRLESASGADFDRVFLKAMAKAQAQTLRLLTHARGRLDEGPVRSFVIATIPTIQRHRELAETLQAKV